MVARLLLLFVLVLTVYYLLEAARAVHRQLGAAGRSGVKSGPAMDVKSVPPTSAGRLVACTVCGVHVPQARALTQAGWTPRSRLDGESAYCSETCRHRAREAS